MKKFPIITLIVALAALLLFQSKVVVPLMQDVASSEFFLTDTETKASSQAISTPMTNMAFMQCNNYIREQFDTEVSITFPSEPINAWDLAGYQYVINAEIEISENNSSPALKKYVCRIQYENGKDQEGAMDKDNWSIHGLSGLDEV